MIAAVQERWAKLPANVRGAGFVIVGAFVLIVMASLVKHLGQRLPSFEVLFVRFLAGLIVILPVVWRAGFRNVLATKRLHMHATRGFVGFMGNMCFFFALVNMAIGDTVTIQFSRPILMVGIALLVLHEKVSWRRAIIALVGFSGVVMITRPFGDGFEPWAIVALGGTFFGTLVVLTIKLLSRTEKTITIMFYFAAFTTLYAFIPAMIVWVTPTWEELALLVLTGALGIIGQSMFTHGVGLGDTSFVMPFDYLRIVYAFGIGIVFFAELPALWSITGAAVIIASSIYLLQAETREKRARTAREAAQEAAADTPKQG